MLNTKLCLSLGVFGQCEAAIYQAFLRGCCLRMSHGVLVCEIFG
jgi:hypothetical protein